MRSLVRCLAVLLGTGTLIPALVSAQVIIIPPYPPPRPRPPIPPRPAPIVLDYTLKQVDVQATVNDQTATIQIAQVFQNNSSTTIEASFLFPLPDDASVSGLTLIADGKELPGKLLKKEEARRIYEEIVRRQRDPALLEFIGRGVFQTSVFPIPGNSERRVEIRYTQLLKKDQGLIDLLLPLGHVKHVAKPIQSLDVTIRVAASDQIKTIYSPTHQLNIERPDNTHAVCRISLKEVRGPEDLRLLYGTTAGQVGMNVITYRPKENEDGYFLLLASPDVQGMATPVDKSVVLVIDRSGSMSGQKIEQARAALKFVLHQLRPTDTFNVVAYDSGVEAFRPELQKADPETIKAALGYADGLFAGGSTNIDGALTTALQMLKDASRPSYVLFLTDGLPTVGEMNEMKITSNAVAANTVGARVFAFGVGYDVNSRLLDRLARELRGQSTYVTPAENIEGAVSGLYNKIGSPLLTNLSLSFDFDMPAVPGSAPSLSRMYPAVLTDLFRGEQLVVVGRYKTNGTARVTLSGSLSGESKRFTFPANFVAKSMDESNAFVEKLWATRRIGEIIDELDLKGQNQELIDELVRLSLQHGIITPYTSFLADEGTNLLAEHENLRRASDQVRLGLEQSEGRGGFAQREFKGRVQRATTAPAAGAGGRPFAPGGGGIPALDGVAKADKLVEENVRNVGAKTFYQKQGQWRDASVTAEQEKNAVRVKQFSPEYFELASKHGGKMAKYFAFSEPVLVNLGDATYLIEPDAEETPAPGATEAPSRS